MHWSHSGKAEDIVGVVDLTSMQETSQGLHVEGKLDLEDSKVAREVWRLVKADAVALSFGYLVVKDRKRRDGVRELRELDIYEVSLTTSPANPDTRVLSAKSYPLDAKVFQDPKTGRMMNVAELHEHTREMAAKSAPVRIARFEA